MMIISYLEADGHAGPSALKDSLVTTAELSHSAMQGIRQRDPAHAMIHVEIHRAL